MGNFISDLWDDVTGKSQVRDQVDASNAANAANLQAQREALAQQDKWNTAAMDLQKEMFYKALAEQSRGTDLSMLFSKLGMAGDLGTQQMGLDNAIKMMMMQQAENRPLNMARQAAIQQAFPALLAMSGLSPLSVGNGYTEANPQSLQRNLLAELGTNMNGINQLMGGQGGAVGSPMGGMGQGQAAGQAASTTTPYSLANIDMNKLLTMSPVAQFQLKQAEDAVKRSLAARGNLNSSEYTAQMGNVGGQIAATETQNAYKRLQDLMTFGQGGQPTSEGWASPQINLSNFGSNAGSALTNAANNRANLYSGYGTSMGNAMQNFGNQQSTGLSTLSNMGYQSAMQGINARAKSPSLLSSLGQLGQTGTGLMNTYNQFRNMFNNSGKNSLANAVAVDPATTSNSSGGLLSRLWNFAKGVI